MLAIARALRSGARTVLLDEPTEGLAPVIIERIGDLIRAMKADGITVLLVEQNLRFATGVADCHHIVDHGTVVQTLTNADVSPAKTKSSSSSVSNLGVTLSSSKGERRPRAGSPRIAPRLARSCRSELVEERPRQTCTTPVRRSFDPAQERRTQGTAILRRAQDDSVI